MIQSDVIIRRHKKLKELSKQHTLILHLCWKIRIGFKKSVELKRIKSYVNWFYANTLKQHFEIKEQYIYPILDKQDKLIRRVLKEHRRIRRLIAKEESLEISLSLLEEELERHIRFEEWVLFKKIQQTIELKELDVFIFNLDTKEDDEWGDKFWEYGTG